VIEHLDERGNVHKGFVYRIELDRLTTHLPEYLLDVVLFAYLSAWRRNEILSLTWDGVDGDSIRLRAENSKEREPRVLALEGELAEVIARRRATKNGPLVFHHDGQRITDYRKARRTAAKMAGIEGKLFHDLRQT